MNMIEEIGKLVDDFAAKAEKIIAKAKEQPPVTGRPFCAGVNEPEVGDVVFNMYLGKVSEAKYGNYAYMKYYLGRGELYPTEADCLYGEKKREIEARYRGMGREFKLKHENWYAWIGSQGTRLDSSSHLNHGLVYFDTPELCQAAIDTINAEYGEGAFAKYVLGVRP